MSWFDIIFIAIVAIFAIIGLWKGLLDSILGLVTTLVSIVLSIWWAKPVAKFLRRIVDIDNIFFKMLKGAFAEKETIKVLGVISLTREKLSAFLTVALSAVIIFILIRLAVWVVSKLFDSATASNSALSGLNRVFGLVFGVAKGLVVCCAILAGLYVVGNTGLTKNLDAKLDNTKVVSFFYKYTGDYVTEKLNASKIQSIIDDMKIEKREDEIKDDVAKNSDAWFIKESYTTSDSDKSTFINDLNYSKINYYNSKSEKTEIQLNSESISIKYFPNTEGAEAVSLDSVFSLKADETSKTIKIKITYTTSDKDYKLEYLITINKPTE